MSQVTEEQIEKAAEEARSSNKKLIEWAEKQGRGVIQQMELRKHILTLDFHWPKLRKSWLGGFVSGVTAGFPIGFKTALKLGGGFKTQIVVAGTEKEVIANQNAELKKFLGEMVGEASMCWENVRAAGKFNSEGARFIVEKLYARFATPMPETLTPVHENCERPDCEECGAKPQQETLPGIE